MYLTSPVSILLALTFSLLLQNSFFPVPRHTDSMLDMLRLLQAGNGEETVVEKTAVEEAVGGDVVGDALAGVDVES